MPKRPQRRLADIATRHQVFLERLKTSHAEDLAGIVREMDKVIRDILNKLDSPVTELTRKKLNLMLADMREANREIFDKATGDMFGHLEKIAGYESGFEVRALQSVLRASSKFTFAAPTAAQAYSLALAQPMSATGELLETFYKTWSGGEIQRLNNAVQRAWGEGWTNDRLTQAIRGTKALNYRDGILATTRRNAQTVARTSIQHVASTGRMATWEANKDVVRGYIFIATLDSVTTQVCRSLDRKKFPLGGGPVPPVHMNCRSTTIADLDPELDFLDEGATRSSIDGAVPAEQSYYDWLKGQSPEFQDEAIGKTRGKLFRDGGLSAKQFGELNLDRNFQPLTLDEMRKLEPLAFKRAGIPNP